MKQLLLTTRRGPEVIIIVKVRLMIQIDLVSRYNKLRVDFNAESRAVLWRSLYEGWLLR